ncbi:hypothetical protein [Serinicoccus sediminis]|uniref:hypothetical protein n=1 Tax=Serinicoccus sediminis TaxID=2306021 RepID=UPI0010216FBF|nr:hypothetical protein [Serinicoccus sediminis]
MSKLPRVVLHLAPKLGTAEHADMANAVSAIAPPGSSVEVDGVDSDKVNEAMDARWTDVPKWDKTAHG